MSLFETLQHRRGRVLFVSQSNDCRDQMAEAFARALGDDSLVSYSAGLYPAGEISPATRAVMAETCFPLFPDQRPKPVSDFDLGVFDVIVNLSGTPIRGVTSLTTPGLILEPLVPSPFAGDLDSHRAVRDRIETLVRFLIDHLRRAKVWIKEDRIPSATSAAQTTPPPPQEAIPSPDAATQPAI